MLVNFDVLTYLMSITEERTDVSSLMRTCRTLYSAGIPSLLSFDIDFDVWERFAAFCSFMDVDAPGRSRFLRRMTLYMHHLTRARRTRTLGHILRILQHASQLHELSIETNDEEQRFDPLDPHLIEALSGLTSIKDLAVSMVTDDTAKILQSFQSPAAKVYLFFEDDWSSSEFSHLDPIFVLKQFGPSLRRLEVLFPAFSQVLRHGIQYPHLTELEISHISPLLALDPLIYSFPNLRILRFSEMDTFGCDHIEGEGATRRANLLSQSQRHWESLDCVSADPVCLYLMGLNCKVHHLQLELSAELGSSRFANVDCIEETLSLTRPTRLDIAICSFPHETGFIQMQLYRAADYLTHLHIKVEFRGREGEDDVSGAIVSFQTT